MTTATDIQTFLRFLSQDAKIPLATAISKMPELQKASLTSPLAIAQSPASAISAIFPDAKQSKTLINAAKRTTKASTSTAGKKRPSAFTSTSSTSHTTKRQKIALTLPPLTTDESLLATTVIYTNRAPLLLAFALTTLNYTLPEQPLSSRLSLSQAMVSTGAKSRAISLGIDHGSTAEDEGWGAGQPVVRVMGRDVRVLKRLVYEDEEEEDGGELRAGGEREGDETNKDKEPTLAYWGLDLEALRRTSTASAPTGTITDLPIHTPQSALSYLLKSFSSPPSPSPSTPSTSLPTSIKPTPTDPDLPRGPPPQAPPATSPTPTSSNSEPPPPTTTPKPTPPAQRSENLSLVLSALDLLFASWSPRLSSADLDARAWTWYAAVRPSVADGAAGWGGRGPVDLRRVLALRWGG
ncbi:MAG: hypothetical protein M1819_003949 [Sarea resinae]|nr:MAG: hypothetical protein M1819_003949 [Sarea resinae]